MGSDVDFCLDVRRQCVLLHDLHLSIPCAFTKTTEVCVALVARVDFLPCEFRGATGVSGLLDPLILLD